MSESLNNVKLSCPLSPVIQFLSKIQLNFYSYLSYQDTTPNLTNDKLGIIKTLPDLLSMGNKNILSPES